ncbi:hypothetical protein ASPWEDRAFT_46813 [Aspergillus wentii DTO 134E9]|uniref:Uncharacterized protein n=1 Tax=Aspergillus wentii DTO 134E9 TaxID=1073089 RepID=A0A1L9R3Z1_ASPWE|nr:uncharacterized protein ASPWEDRAFT_46813 [Aspergillus wentii DTO 134E9]OJJ29624.1 hypothetical protein ASPWEDRAFT_46813 [Aspergillus wentii DTO 134E9]
MSISNNEMLVDVCESTRKSFSDKFYPLTTERSQAIQRCTAIVKIDRGSISKNGPKLRAHTILSDLWLYCPEVFILCALSTYPTKIGGLKSDDYLETMLRWWENVAHPKGLTAVLIQYPDILPGKPNMPSPSSYPAHLQESDLIDFLTSGSRAHGPLTIKVPDDYDEMPVIEISREMCQDLIRFVLERQKERLSHEFKATEDRHIGP